MNDQRHRNFILNCNTYTNPTVHGICAFAVFFASHVLMKGIHVLEDKVEIFHEHVL